MACLLATLHWRKLAAKSREEEITTVSAKAAGEEATTWAAKCAEQNQKYPSRTLYNAASVALQSPPTVEIQQQDHDHNIRQLELQVEERARTAAIMKYKNSEERAEKLAEFTKQKDASRAHRAKAILARAMRP